MSTAWWQLIVWLLVGTLAGCGAQTEPPPEAEDQEGEAAEVGSRAEIEAVQADVRKLQEALFSGDVKTVVDLTNAEALAALGSDQADAEGAVEEGMALMKSGGVELELLTFPEDPTFVSGEKHDFVLVPMLAAFKVGDLRVETKTFLLGVRPSGGGKWTYVDGEQFADESVQQLFPDFPPEQQLPDTHKRQL